jgi:hypothetical protein
MQTEFNRQQQGQPNRAARRATQSPPQPNTRPNMLQITLMVGTRIVGVLVAIAALPLSVVVELCSYFGSAIVWVSRQLIALTGGGRAYLTGGETIQEKFFHGLILLSFGNSARQWIAALSLMPWAIALPYASFSIAILGFTASLFTQVIQSRLLRRDTPEVRYAQAENLAQYDHMNPAAFEEKIDIAKNAADKYNKAGVLSSQMIGAVVCSTWIIETMVMGTGAVWPNPAISFAGLAVLAANILQAFSTEMLIKLEEDKDPKVTAH